MEFVTNDDGTFTLRLSRRNLLALLTKLEHPESARTIVDSSGLIAVTAEPDDEHYRRLRRAAGAMHPVTEAEIRAAGVDGS